MHPWRPWLAIVLALASIGAYAAVIYKWTDADGVVHFSDQAVPGAEKITIAGTSSRGIGAPTVRGPQPEAAKAASMGVVYSEFNIDSPQPEENFTGDVVVAVHLKLVPALRENQTITWTLNGRALADQAPDATGFGLSNLARGTYTLSAKITDQVSGESANSGAVNFYIRQPSSLMPQNKAR